MLTSVALVLAIAFWTEIRQTRRRCSGVVRVVARGAAAVHQQFQAARPPSAWLADIAALRRAGRNREADEELRRFRSAYPTYPVYPAYSAAIRPCRALARTIPIARAIWAKIARFCAGS